MIVIFFSIPDLLKFHNKTWTCIDYNNKYNSFKKYIITYFLPEYTLIGKANVFANTSTNTN